MTPEDRWLCSGFLEKESKGDNWNRRYFVLDGVSLKYYKRKPCPDEPDSQQCRGEIRLRKVCQVQPTKSCQGKEWSFEVRMSNGPAIFLVAQSREDMEDWIDNILTHPLFSTGRRGSMDESALRLASTSGYTTKVVGGVVIRTQIPASDDSAGRPSFLAALDMCDSGITGSQPETTSVMASDSKDSVATWASATSMAPFASPSRSHRRDGARVIKTGFCVKQGGRRRTWKRRYFLLDPFGLAYYQYKRDKEPIRNIPLQLLVSVGVCKSFPDRDYVLQVMTVGRIFYMQCDTHAECIEWIEAIRSVVPQKTMDDGELPMLKPEGDVPTGRSNSICTPPSKNGRQLWRLSLGRCRDFLQPMSDDSDEDDEKECSPQGASHLPIRIFERKNS